MKDLIRKKLSESLVFEFIDSIIDEDYPATWNIDEFKKLNSFNDRIKYCEEHLTRISSGSSRIVYKIDDIKVLKLAKNKKGLVQNEVEIEYGQYNDLKYILARVFEYDENNLWVEMELAQKLTNSKFKQIVGIDFEAYGKLLNNYGIESGAMKKGHKYTIPQELVDWSWENEFMYDIYQYIGGYDVPPYDLTRLSSYGIVKRDGVDTIIIIDYGLTEEVASTYYS